MEENNQNNLPEKKTENSVSYPFLNQLISEQKQELEKETEKNDFPVKKLGWAGIFIAVLNPVFAGLILGALFLTEPKLRRFGVATAAISIIWGAISYFLLQKYWNVSFSGF